MLIAQNSFCNDGAGPPPKAKRDPQATDSLSDGGDSDSGDSDNSTMTLPDLAATGVPIIANGTVEPDFSSLFTVGHPKTDENSMILIWTL